MEKKKLTTTEKSLKKRKHNGTKTKRDVKKKDDDDSSDGIVIYKSKASEVSLRKSARRQQLKDDQRAKLQQIHGQRNKSLAAKFILSESSVTYRPPSGFYGNFGSQERNVQGQAAKTDEEEVDDEVDDESSSSVEFVTIRKPKQGFISNEVIAITSEEEGVTKNTKPIVIRSNVGNCYRNGGTRAGSRGVCKDLELEQDMDYKRHLVPRVRSDDTKSYEITDSTEDEDSYVSNSSLPPESSEEGYISSDSSEDCAAFYAEPGWRHRIGSFRMVHRNGRGAHKSILEVMANGDDKDRLLLCFLKFIILSDDSCYESSTEHDESSYSSTSGYEDNDVMKISEQRNPGIDSNSESMLRKDVTKVDSEFIPDDQMDKRDVTKTEQDSQEKKDNGMKANFRGGSRGGIVFPEGGIYTMSDWERDAYLASKIHDEDSEGEEESLPEYDTEGFTNERDGCIKSQENDDDITKTVQYGNTTQQDDSELIPDDQMDKKDVTKTEVIYFNNGEFMNTEVNDLIIIQNSSSDIDISELTQIYLLDTDAKFESGNEECVEVKSKTENTETGDGTTKENSEIAGENDENKDEHGKGEDPESESEEKDGVMKAKSDTGKEENENEECMEVKSKTENTETRDGTTKENSEIAGENDENKDEQRNPGIDSNSESMLRKDVTKVREDPQSESEEKDGVMKAKSDTGQEENETEVRSGEIEEHHTGTDKSDTEASESEEKDGTDKSDTTDSEESV